ncbi:hypothetical protein BGX33_002569 [Mortierella sp. NVP41]|nr:hypothetical protein BGX33_002569 [Mortierella sp. NVP41]
MFIVLRRLHNLWFVILVLASICLISNILFLSLNISPANSLGLSVPLAASFITVVIFAYGLWGKSNPYLLPTSSPRSNPCTRSVRHFGTSLLTLVWVASTAIYATTGVVVERVFAGLALLISVLVIVESISSSRLGREQRRILKQEERRLQMLKVTAASGSTLVAGGGGPGGDKKSSLDNNNGDNDGNNDDDENALKTVEIVRPEPIDPATVIYNQQLLFETAQRQYHQQYQHYLIQQARTDGASGGLGDGSQQQQHQEEEGKYDDILLESSYKFEIPMDNNNNGISSSSSNLHLAVSSSPSSSSTSFHNEKLHTPSAPPAPPSSLQPLSSSLSWTGVPSPSKEPPKAPQGIPATHPYQPQRTRSLLKNDISPVGIQVMADTNPFRDQDYEAVTELSASAPPYEPSSSSFTTSSTTLPKFGEQSSSSIGGSPFDDDGSNRLTNTIATISTTKSTTTENSRNKGVKLNGYNAPDK